MEFECTIIFKIDADNFEDAERKANAKIINNTFVIDNMEIECTDAVVVEHLKLKAFVQISKYRENVMIALKNAGVNGMMPKEIAEECDILVNHISKTLSELVDKGLIVCINPRARKGRIYRLTDIGNIIGGLL